MKTTSKFPNSHYKFEFGRSGQARRQRRRRREREEAGWFFTAMADHAAAAAAIIIQRNCHSNTDELTEEADRARERPLRSVV